MRQHPLYNEIIEAIKGHRLEQPFSAADIMRACPGRAPGSYRAFVWKYAGGERRQDLIPLLDRVAPGRYRLRPER